MRVKDLVPTLSLGAIPGDGWLSVCLLDQLLVTCHPGDRFVRFEVLDDPVLRRQDVSAPTHQQKQWRSRLSDIGVVVAEFTRMLNP